MLDVRQQKKKLRKEILQKRSNLEKNYRSQANALIARRLKGMLQYQNAATVMYYVDFRGEVETRQLIEDALSSGKRVCVPLTHPKEKRLILCQITSLSDLQKGHYGVMEPDPNSSHIISPKEVDFVVNPGVAFDLERRRLGYGGGYYDRFALQLRVDCVRVALAFECQMVDKVPVDEYDLPVDVVITEKRIISSSTTT